MDKSCFFTGHRVLTDDIVHIKNQLELYITYLIDIGVKDYYAGGALGFDMVAEEMVLEMKKKYEDVKLYLVLPCEGQEKKWSAEQKERYEIIKKQADGLIYTSKEYFKGCMHLRNRYLVDNSDYCICYKRKETGGTAYTVNYATKKGMYIYNI